MMKRTDNLIIFIVLALLYTGCTASLPKDHPAGPKTYKNSMDKIGRAHV